MSKKTNKSVICSDLDCAEFVKWAKKHMDRNFKQGYTTEASATHQDLLAYSGFTKERFAALLHLAIEDGKMEELGNGRFVMIEPKKRNFICCPRCKAKSKVLYSEFGGLQTRRCQNGHQFEYDKQLPGLLFAGLILGR